MSQRALLLIADIGGYTRFMRVHRINLAHAQYVVARLLEAVIDGAEPRLKLAKLEGDAAFFYALLPDGKKTNALAAFADVVASIRREFVARRMELETDRLCSCDSCMQAGQLKLKFVAHVGEIAFQKVKRYTELAGVDVIFVHRLLKNSVPVPEYVLMSEPVFQEVKAFSAYVRSLSEELEGLGSVSTFYVDLTEVASEQPEDLEPSFGRRLLAWLRMTWRSLPYFVGLRRSCDGFQNLEAVSPALALPGASMPPPDGDSVVPPSLEPPSAPPIPRDEAR
jgi:class 3 adenylate cyclase